MERQQNDTLANARMPARGQMSGAVPAGLRYDIGQVEGLPATRAMRRYYSSTGGAFSPANPTIRFDVASANHLDLNSALLCFTITNGSGVPIKADGGAACCIERLRVLSNQGQVLESIDHYNLWAATTSQFTATQEEANALSILAQGPITITDNTTAGEWEEDAVYPVSVPLKCAFFQNASAKYLPANCGFTLELTLAAANAAFVRGGAGDIVYTVTNAYLQVPDVQINDPGFHANLLALAAENDGLISWSGLTAKTSFGSLQGAANHTIHINDRSRSLRGLMTVFRNNAVVAASTVYSLSAKSIEVVSQWGYEVAGRPCPAQAVDVVVPRGTSATYAQLMRLWSSTGSMNTGLVTRTAFDGTYASAAAIACIGCALESFEDGSLYSGIDTASMAQPVSLRVTTAAAIGATVVEATTYALCDIEFSFNIMDGSLNASI